MFGIHEGNFLKNNHEVHLKFNTDWSQRQPCNFMCTKNKTKNNKTVLMNVSYKELNSIQQIKVEENDFYNFLMIYHERFRNV